MRWSATIDCSGNIRIGPFESAFQKFQAFQGGKISREVQCKVEGHYGDFWETRRQQRSYPMAKTDFCIGLKIVFGSINGAFQDYDKETRKWLQKVGRASRLPKLANELFEEAAIKYVAEPDRLSYYVAALRLLVEQFDSLLLELKTCLTKASIPEKLRLSIGRLVAC